jgi:hypothetical protein
MRPELTTITPALARQWLERNTTNRTLRPNIVSAYRRAFERGEYRISTQGIAFNVNGDLGDGQHRLTAIANMPDDFAVQMWVFWDVPLDAFDVIDQGLRRTAADVLNIGQPIVAIARICAVVHLHGMTQGLTPQLLQPYVDGVQPAFAELMAACPTVHRTFSSARVRAAACLRLLENLDPDYVKLSYGALNRQEYNLMQPIVQSLNRQADAALNVQKSRSATSGMALFVRSFVAFDASRQQIETLAIADAENVLEKARIVIVERVLHKAAIHEMDKSRAARRVKHG